MRSDGREYSTRSAVLLFRHSSSTQEAPDVQTGGPRRASRPLRSNDGCAPQGRARVPGRAGSGVRHQREGPARQDPLPRQRSPRGPRPRDCRGQARAGLPRRGDGDHRPRARRRQGNVLPALRHRGRQNRLPLGPPPVPSRRAPRPQVRRGLRRRLRQRSPRGAYRERRGRVRGVWHPGSRVPVGRLQGRRRPGEGPPDDEQRSRGRSRALRGQEASLLRALDVQVRDRGQAGRRRGAHHPYRRLGGLWMESRPVELGVRPSASSCPRPGSPSSSWPAGSRSRPRGAPYASGAGISNAFVPRRRGGTSDRFLSASP